MMKKIFTLLLTVIMCLSASITVFAAGSALTATGDKAERNDYVYVTLALEDCKDANTLAITYEYDTDVLQKIANRCKWSMEGDFADFVINKNEGVWYNSKANGVDGEICQLGFRIMADAPIGKTIVKCTVTAKDEAKVIGTYTVEAEVEVTCAHVAAEDAVGTKVDAEKHKYVCELCGTDVVENHIWDKGVVTKAPTTTEVGVKTYTCTFCKDTKDETIPMLEPEEGDEPGGDEPGGNEPGGDTPGGNKPGTEEPGTDKPGTGEQGGTTPPAGDSGNQGGTTTPDTEKPETNKPETNKPESNKPGTTTPDNSQQGGTTTPNTDNTPVVEIKDAVVKEKVDEIQKAEEGKEVVIEMKQDNGKVATVVPVEILDAVKGKDVDVVLDMGEYSWTINGKDVKDGAKDINLEVALDTKAVDEAVVKELAGTDTARQISLTHDGEFNFKATLTINVGKDFVGKFGNLYYHEGEGKLTFVSAAKVDENGDVSLDFNHASDYVVVLGDDRTADENQEGTTTPDAEDTQKPNDENNSQQPSGDDKPSNGNDGGINVGAIFTVILIIGAIAGAAYYFMKKK